MRRDGEDDPDNWCEDTQPPSACLKGEAKTCPKHAGEQSMPAETEQRIPAAKLLSIWCNPGLSVALGYVECCLRPVEPDTHQRAVNEAVAHVVELGAQQPE